MNNVFNYYNDLDINDDDYADLWECLVYTILNDEWYDEDGDLIDTYNVSDSYFSTLRSALENNTYKNLLQSDGWVIEGNNAYGYCL